MRKSLWAAGAALALVSTAAFASVTLTVDGDTATGFVGKGDVQSAFGFNNGQMQPLVNNVTFTFSDHLTVSWTCSWVTGEGTRGEQTHVQDVDRSGTLSAVFTGPSRKNGNDTQGTGWILTGSVHTTGSINGLHGELPVDGETCQGDSLEGPNGTISNSTITEGGGSLTATIPGYGTRTLDSSGITVII